MKSYILHILLLLLMPFIACANEPARVVIGFNDAWRFTLGDAPQALDANFDGASWRELTLPHDWSIEGNFSEAHPAGSGGGALPGGIGWYRKRFKIEEALRGKKVFIDFDGVYMNSEVWINGHCLGKRPNGYISFRYDLTPHIHYGGNNVIAVRVDNSRQPNSRWYSGSGIYRNVWLTITDPVHVDLWGTFVSTPEVSEKEALVRMSTRVKNESAKDLKLKVTTAIIDAEGKKQSETSSFIQLKAGSGYDVMQDIQLQNPKSWSGENPYLYTVETRIYEATQLRDEYRTTLGVRDFSFDADKGFILNKVPTKIKGVCLHHDLGCLGAAVNTSAMRRQLNILKGMGVNGIRTAHNPPAPELLQLCDEMGFIVMNETFDMWRRKKTTYDYANYFDEWFEKDMTDHFMRDRNHPSVFMWSVGNEVLEQWTDANADTLDIQQANLLLNQTRDSSMLAKSDNVSENSRLALKIVQIAKKLDPTRPIMTSNNEPKPGNHLFKSGAMDIIGFNYHDADYVDVKKNFPGKPFIATETTSALMTRGYYRMPSDSMFIWPVRWDIPFYEPSYSCSSYDNCHVPWGTTHEKTWNIVKRNDFISGLYVWTGFDYIGEPTPFQYPAKSSYFGIVDLAGFPKDVYYMYQSEWTRKAVLHVFPHWNWRQGEVVDVWAYYNQADEAELFLNGVSQGIRRKIGDDLHVSWRLAFNPGQIQVVTRKDGKEILSQLVKTASEPYQIRLTPDNNNIKADGVDLCFVTVEVLDKDGVLCPSADDLIEFSVSDKGFVAGVDNGNPISLEKFKASERKAFNGKCLVVIQNRGEKGGIILKAQAKGLKSAKLNIKIK